MRMKWTGRILRMSDNKMVKQGTKQQAITRKAKEALDGLCGRRFTQNRNLKIRHRNWKTTCITPGDSRRHKSMEGVGGDVWIDVWNQGPDLQKILRFL